MVKNFFALKKAFVILFGFGILNFSLHAQNSTSPAEFKDLAVFQSFQEKKYQQVVDYYENSEAQSEAEEAILLLSQLKTGNENIQDVENWCTQNDKHPLNTLVTFHIGAFHFYQGDSLKSEQYLSKVGPSELSIEDKASYGYLYGIIQLRNERYQNALDLLRFSRKHGFEDQDKLDYYLAFANYHLGNEDEALDGFMKAKETAAFNPSSNFFIAKINLESGNQQEVLKLATDELSEDRTSMNSGFYQLIGEAYALNGETAKADAFFERAIELHPSTPTAALYYQAGVSKFKLGNEDQAMEYMTAAGIQGGQYAELSAFQLGRLYLKKGDYNQALFAYQEASAAQNVAMKEEAIYQTALIHAKLGNHSESINYAQDYLANYDDYQKTAQIKNLLAESLLRTSNYDQAIAYLQGEEALSEAQKGVYQKVTFQKAVLLFNDGDFKEADQWFTESTKQPKSTELLNESYFHLGEIAMQNNRLDQAISYYQKQASPSAETNYGLGYSYYNKQKYLEAISYFTKAQDAQRLDLKTDAQIKLADCYYATKSYQRAIKLYETSSTPYVNFQKGLAYKALGNSTLAIQSFQQASMSTYQEKSKLEIGKIHMESADFMTADQLFTEVIEGNPSTRLEAAALLNRGICKMNLNQLSQAKSDYLSILDNHIQSNEAINAILGLQELEQAGLTIKNLDNYVSKYKEENPEDGSVELIEFESAKSQYFSSNYKIATARLSRFIKDYPNASSLIEARFYLAESHFRLDEWENARESYNQIRNERNVFTGRVLNRLGSINSQLNNVDLAIDAFAELESLNLSAKDNYQASEGLMKAYFEKTEYQNAINYATKIIESDWKPLNAEREALFMRARSYKRLNQNSLAIEDLKELSVGTDRLAAEASYLIAEDLYLNAEYDPSLDRLFDMNAKFGSYQDVMDRSFLIIAKNYISKEELFQAKATLRSIIQHASNEVIIKESQQLLEGIEQNIDVTDSTLTNGK